MVIQRGKQCERTIKAAFNTHRTLSYRRKRNLEFVNAARMWDSTNVFSPATARNDVVFAQTSGLLRRSAERCLAEADVRSGRRSASCTGDQLDVPTMLPAGNASRCHSYWTQRHRGSSRSQIVTSQAFAGIQPASFIECTAISARFSRSAALTL